MRASFLLLLPLALAACAGQPPALNLTRTIPLPDVKGRFDHFSIDLPGRRLFVAALGNNTLEVIDLVAAKRIRSVAGMSKPTGVLYLAQRNQVLVANGDDGTLKILDGASYAVTKSTGRLEDADNLRWDARNQLVYLGYGEGALAVINTVTGQLGTTVRLPKHPESFQLEQDGPRVFVNVPDARQVMVVDRARQAVVSTWSLDKFGANFPMALDEPNHRLFVGCRQPARLVVLDTATGKPVADLGISGDTDDLFYDATLRRLYLSCGAGFVDVIEQRNADSYQLRERIPTRAGARTSFLSRELNEFYLAVPERGRQPAELRVFQVQR